MNNENAKFVLQAYRANGADASDPEFRAALEQARQDPELAQWLEKQLAFDRAVGAKLRSIQPPADLRQTILAGAEVAQQTKRSWWYQPRWVAIAAALILSLSVGTFGLLNTRADAAETFPVFATDYVTSGFFLKEHSADLGKLRQWLLERNAPIPSEIPAGFAELRSLGCKTLDYRGKQVSLICFGEGKEYHLFVAKRSDFPEFAGSENLQFFVRSGHASATWSDTNNHYVVVTDDSLKALMECMECQST